MAVRWYVLQYFGGLPLLVLGTLHILAATTSSPQIHAILYACLFLLTIKVHLPNPLKLWASCTLQAKGLIVYFP